MKIITCFIFLSLLTQTLSSQPFELQQKSLDGNNVSTFIQNKATFNSDIRSTNTPGLMWPRGSNKFAFFTTGFTIAAYVSGQLRMSAAYYGGEYRPGYSQGGQFFTESRFRFYKVSKGDNYVNNPDWLNWGDMVPFGAPYIDVDGDEIYNYHIDTPGVSNASQTIFICLTDGDSTFHTIGTGFGGGTKPLFAEVHLIAWCYDNVGLDDAQFFNWNVTNKSNFTWDSVYFGIVCDPDLGAAGDDYTGCDTNLNLQYVYNADNMDGTGNPPEYGLNPPAAGMCLLKGAVGDQISYGASSLRVFHKAEPCDRDPNSSIEGYRLLKGLKNDGTPYVVPNTSPPVITKFTYPGNPETAQGWTEFSGRVNNCGGSLFGQIVVPAPPADRRMMICSGSTLLSMDPGDKQTICMSQMVAQGTNNLNAVTKLKTLAQNVITFYNKNDPIGINLISTTVPDKFELYQNYPNPFNPVTNLGFGISNRGFVSLNVYDALGKEVTELVNESKPAGRYNITFDGSNLSSGIYFYSLTVDGVMFETKRMILLK